MNQSIGFDDTVLVRGRRRDPRHVVVLEQPAERSDEPAAAAAEHALAVGAAIERHGPAVGDDDQRPAAGHVG
jgi:hypothetical protein